jgi:hypothetical protein
LFTVPVLRALAAFIVLTAGVVLPATTAEAGPARTAECRFVPAGGESESAAASETAVAGEKTPAHRRPVPTGAITFTSPDGFGGRARIVGPRNGTCVAHGGLDLDFDQQITLPGQRTPAFEQVFGAGGDYQLRYGCRYLPSLRAYADRRDCPAPPATDHIDLVDTGVPSLSAAVVEVGPHASDRQLRTSGTAPVLAVVLAFDLGGDPDDQDYRVVTVSYADCRLTAICVTSLRAFVDEAIAFQHRYTDFRVTGDPGSRIRAAIA